MKKLIAFGIISGLILILAGLVMAKVNDFYIKTGDRLPYYTFQVVDAAGTAIDISSTTITATVQNLSTSQEIVTDGAVNITNGTSGYAEYRWADGSTNTAGSYAIEFKIISGGLQYTLPAAYNALVIIKSRY